MEGKNLRIVFMGTPEFAVGSLKLLHEAGKNIVGVITAPDKPAGRGMQIHSSPVKEYAVANKLNLLQPEKLKGPEFIEQLKKLKPDLQVVVAFRMLPEIVWSIPSCGTFNLHASLLPDYRGAAPINWVLINGEKKTGVTTFFINNEIDTGKIIFSEITPINEKETAGQLHDRLMNIGARLVLKTVNAISSNSFVLYEQSEVQKKDTLKTAPKIYKENCRINWNKDVNTLYNFIRGLSPYPAAFTEIENLRGERYVLKIFEADKVILKHNTECGAIESDGKKIFRIAASNGYIDVMSLQLQGKKRLNVVEFLRGFQNYEQYKIVM